MLHMKQTKEQIMKQTECLLVDDAAIISLYKQVLSGQLKKFPRFTWELPNSLYYAKVITRFVVEKKLKWSIEDIKSHFNTETIIKYKLRGMYSALFNCHFTLIDNAYPDKIFPWELAKTPQGYWICDENKRTALRWLFVEKLGGDLQFIKKNLSQQTFIQFRLIGLLEHFQNSPYQALEFMYLGKVKPWELGVAPNGFWHCDKNKREALKWLFEEIFEGDLKKIKQNLCANTFKQYGLTGLFNHFNQSPYQTLEFMYPGEVKPWELETVPNGFWHCDSNKHKALKWLFEDVFEGNLTQRLSRDTFKQYKLMGLFIHFNESPHQVVEFYHSGNAKSWEISS